ncbi:MAG: response regulator [Candidatus Binatia bacterium]
MNGTVLIVDEEANARIIAAALLPLRQLHVRSATNVGEACDIACQEDVAVVVLNLNSQLSNGFEALRQLRKRCGTLRIVVVTDWEEPAVERLARRLGADAFLRKPMSPDQLITAVEELTAIALPPNLSWACP